MNADDHRTVATALPIRVPRRKEDGYMLFACPGCGRNTGMGLEEKTRCQCGVWLDVTEDKPAPAAGS